MKEGTTWIAIFVGLVVGGLGIGGYFLLKGQGKAEVVPDILDLPSVFDIMLPPPPPPIDIQVGYSQPPEVFMSPVDIVTATPDQIKMDHQVLAVSPILRKMESAPNMDAKRRLLNGLEKETMANPNSAQSWIDLALGYSLTEQYDKAYAALKRALRIDPNIRGREAIEAIIREYEVRSKEVTRKRLLRQEEKHR